MSPNRSFVLVNLTLWKFFHTAWHQIEREWYGDGYTEHHMHPAVRSAVDAARNDLRRQVRAMAPSFPPDDFGIYLIPV